MSVTSRHTQGNDIPRWLEHEDRILAPYAMRTRCSRGRRYPEASHPFRTLYQRDRDRIVHSAAFRRLMYKTQVLVSQTDDYHRTRLTHTLEVAQISRTIARELGLNEDLTEAIALAHDLGHPPFGHAGEVALDECMKSHGGFEHNRHSLRIVDELEYRYPDFPGLNLSWEVRQAIGIRTKAQDEPEVKELLEDGQSLLEAQVVDSADSCAYNAHDLDDALWAKLITLADVREVPIWREAEEGVRQRFPRIGPGQFQPTVIRTLIDWQVRDLIENTQRLIVDNGILNLDDVRRAPVQLVAQSERAAKRSSELEGFLHSAVYRHHRVLRMAAKGSRFLKLLFGEYRRCPGQLPERYERQAAAGRLERTVCNYLAGMTDRFAQDEYLRLFQPFANV
jgi:dGTPase